jgi:hypothetical protein
MPRAMCGAWPDFVEHAAVPGYREVPGSEALRTIVNNVGINGFAPKSSLLNCNSRRNGHVG